MSGGLARLVVFGAAAGAAWLAYRAGGGADAQRLPPSADRSEARSDAQTGAPAGGAEGYEIAVRLVEKMGEARVEGAGAAQRGPLVSYWRKMPVPWAPLTEAGAKWTTSIALRASATETQTSMPTASGAPWDPDARIWNVNEGSFDERAAIALPTPGTVTFHVTVPARARLDFATALLGGKGETELGITVVDAQGRPHDVFTRAAPARDAKEWLDASVDLSPWSGQAVDLRLRAVPKLMVALQAGMSQVEASTSAVALWDNPRILTQGPTTLPYDVLWINVDGLRPDVLASFHDDDEDQRRLRAKRPPLDALLPKIPGLTPAIDDLAARGVRFTHAYSNGAWTRPGALAMLAGARSSELGIDTLSWIVPPDQAARFYASQPPLLPLLLRRAGAMTRAIVNDYFMVGYAPVGVDMGFERLDDHRYRTRDTLEITTRAAQWMKSHQADRFFLFCDLHSPHEPWDPPERLKDRVPKPPAGPADPTVRLYLAEAAKDDEAIGVLLRALDELHLRERTLVVLTADHGETLSKDHDGKSGLDKMQVRFHHAVGNYEETARVPILLALPGVLPEGREVKARVRTIDLAPTVLELLGLDRAPKMSGASLMPLVRGEAEPDERVVLTEGRGTRALLAGKWRLIVREGAAQTTTNGEKPITVSEELFELDDDPGERHNVAREQPDVLAEMRARLEASKKNVAVAGTQAARDASSADASARAIPVHLRFAGAGRARRVSATITLADPKARFVAATPVGAPPESVRVDGARVELALTTAPDAIVGVDLRTDPPAAPLAWEIFVDETPLAPQQVFAGPFGFAAPALLKGLTTDEARTVAYAPAVPAIDPRRDLGMFVTRDRPGETPVAVPDRELSAESTEEMTRVLREWGYAHGPAGPAAPTPVGAKPKRR